MHTYPYIEDYIEIIAGYTQPNGKANQNIFTLFESPISLARYDVKVVESFAEQSTAGIGLTDKQAVLARDLVYKYERQLRKLGVDISTVKETVQYRLPIRELDRSKRIWVENDRIKVRFPYKTDVIELVRATSKESNGHIGWNVKDRIWECDVTEYTVNWAHTFATTHGFEIDATVQHLMDQILAVESVPYAIQLQASDQLEITNAPDTLKEYVAQNLGGFALDNLLNLVDHAPLLGYTIDSDIESAVIQAYSSRFYSLCTNRELKVDLNIPTQDQIAEIVQYAHITKRFPIYVYEPDMSDRLIMLFIRHFTKGEIVDLDATPTGITDQTKLVYARKVPKQPVARIPVLVSAAGMLFGGDRQLWVQSAEKAVYFTKEVFGKRNVGKEIPKL
jgi:hypothetical protein